MTIYSPQEEQEAAQQIYQRNVANRLKAMKIAKHISTLTAPIIVRAEIVSSLYDPNFSVGYYFTYGPYDALGEWLDEACSKSEINTMTNRRFTFSGTVNGEEISVNVIGQYEEPNW